MFKRKAWPILFSVLLLFPVLAGCDRVLQVKTAADIPLFPITIGGITLISAPEKAAVLSPSLAGIALELGYGALLAAVSGDVTLPEGAPDIQRVGDAANPDVDALIALEPDVLLTQRALSKRDMERLAAADILVFILRAATAPEELQALYTDVGTILGGAIAEKYANAKIKDGSVPDAGADRGGRLYADVQTAVRRTQAKLLNPPPSFIYLLSMSDNRIATGDTFAGRFLGQFGQNLAGESTGYAVDIDAVKAANPAVVMCALPVARENLASNSTYKSFDAVADGRVFSVDNSAFTLQTSAALIRAIEDISASELFAVPQTEPQSIQQEVEN